MSMKKIFAVVLCVCMVLGTMGIVASAATLITSADMLIDAAAVGGSYVLGCDITIPGDDATVVAAVPADVEFILDLEGFTVTRNNTTAETRGPVFENNGGVMTLTNGNIVTDVNRSYAVNTYAGTTNLNVNITTGDNAHGVVGVTGGVANIFGGVYTNTSACGRTTNCVYVENAVVNIYDGAFSGPFPGADSGSVVSVSGASTLLVEGGSFGDSIGNTLYVGSNSTATVVGGTFTKTNGIDAYIPNGATVSGGVVVTPAASINGTYHSTLTDAIAAANVGDAIILNKNITTDSTFVIGADKEFTLDLNGYVISADFEVSGTSKLIDLDGKLTVQDSSAEQTGKISSHAVNPDTQEIPGYASNTIVIGGGTLILNSGTIENLTESGGACYAIDTKWAGSGEANIIINGGKVAAEVCAIRLAAWRDEIPVNLTVTDGEIIGGRGIWMQLPGGNTPREINMDITGGSITGTDSDDLAIYSYSFGNGFDKIDVNITGGTITGDIGFGGGAERYNCSGTESVRIGGTVAVDGAVENYNTITEDNIVIYGGTFTGDVSEFTDAVEVDGVYYKTVQAALASLSGKTGDYTVVIAPGTYDEDFIIKQEIGLNITIKAENKGEVVMKGMIVIDGSRNHTATETLDIENLVFDASDAGEHYFIKENDTITNDSAVLHTYLHNLTVKNCDFIGNGQGDAAPVVALKARASYNVVFDGCTARDMHSFVQAASNINPLTVKNSTFTNMSEGVVNATASPVVIFTGNYVETDGYTIRTGQNSDTVNDATDITMTDNTIKAGTAALVMRNTTTTATMEDNSIVAPAIFAVQNSAGSVINNTSVNDAAINETIGTENAVVPVKMTVSLEPVEEGIYDIVLSAEDDIYEFVGAELTFSNTSTTVAGEDMQYAVSAVDGKTTVDVNAEKADTYAIRLIEGADRMSGNDMIIGQVKFFGYGNINFTVAEGTVVTTVFGTNLEQYYKTADYTLLADGIINGSVEEIKRDVIVNVAYKHALDGTYWNDNEITVTIKDGFDKVYDAVDISDGSVTFEDVQLGRLTVTLEAPGFRRYVYTTVLEAGANENDALVLNFWNDAKRNEEIGGTIIDPELEIEAGVSGKMAHNFLVGDIVMDYTVDEYDLAAVTSYYGMYGLTDAVKYLKYDLNRDGNIDIIDVAYVLHSLDY